MRVGDIIEFSNEYKYFKPYMYGRKHVITKVDEDGSIWTKGYEWSYRDHGDANEELRTKRENHEWVIKVTPPKSWDSSKLKFLFINSDQVDSLN